MEASPLAGVEGEFSLRKLRREQRAALETSAAQTFVVPKRREQQSLCRHFTLNFFEVVEDDAVSATRDVG